MSGELENQIEFRCGHCSKRLKAKLKLAGRRIKCPNCSGETRVPESPDAGAAQLASQRSSGLSVATQLDDAAGISSKSLSTPSSLETLNDQAETPATTPAPIGSARKPSSFDVDDLQLESFAIADLSDRQQASEQIRLEKETKRRQQLAAEQRRHEDTLHRRNFDSRGAQDESAQNVSLRPASQPHDDEDDYALLPEMTPVPNAARANLASILDDELLPKLAASTPVASSPAKSTQAASSTGTSSRGTTDTARGTSDLNNLDELVPELPEQKIANTSLQDSMSFLDDVVEDKYRVTCPTCGTIQYVTVAAKGSRIKCPDCFSQFRVPAPPANWTPSKVSKRHETFSTSDPLSSDAELRRIDKLRKQATSEMLEKAQVDLRKEQEEENRYGAADFDTSTFIQRTFGFLKDPVALGFIFGYSLVFALVFAMVQYGVSHANEDEFGKGAALFCVIVGPLIAVLFGLPLISAALAQLEAIANHQPKVQDWPGFDMFENLADLLSVACALLMSAIPGFLVGWFLGGDLEGAGRFQIMGAMLSVLLLFPVFLLSILDTGNLFQLVSLDVLRSIREVKEAWAGYYFKCMLFAVIMMIAWFLLLGKGKSAVLGAIAGASFPTAVFFLFQQVGALADQIGEHLSFSFSKPDKDTDQEDQIEDLEDAV